MSDNLTELYSDEELGDAEYLRESSDNLNGVSSDSASTFEYVERHLSPDTTKQQWLSERRDSFSPIEAIEHDNDGEVLVGAVRPLACSSTKEEKQRHNEEIVVMESVSASSETGSWEAVPMHEKPEDAKENCRLFLRNERRFTYDAPAKPATAGTKPCFIDASSLLDDEDTIYTPPPSVCHKAYNAVNMLQLQKSFADEDKDDCATGSEPFEAFNRFDKMNEEAKTQTTYDIKDQFSAIEKPFKPRSKFVSDENVSSRDHEKHQGNLIFQNSIPQYSGHLIKQLNDDNYTSDMSIQSVHSSASGEPKELADFANTSSHYNSLCENTSDYNSGYSRIQSDSDSIVLPDTPFNSIVQVARQLKIFEPNDVDDDDIDRIDGKLERTSESERQASCPMKIPKRTMKYDEFAPVLSGGASVKDFTPKPCESPATRRKTDSCPIVSGGSVDIEEVEEKLKKKDVRKSSTSSQSWIVDFNELKIHESDDRQPKSLDYSSSNQNNALGFYVDFNSLNTHDTKQFTSLDDTKRNVEAVKLDEKSSKKSTGFYVDFSDSSRPDTPKQVPEVTQSKPKTVNGDKKNMFSMFIDFNEGKNKAEGDKGGSQEEIKTEAKPEQSTSKDSQDDEKDKKGCYMFIESDSPVVKRRSLINKNDTKRHSWNVNPQEGPSEAQRTAKTYQRSTSVTNDKGMMNILDKIPMLSKTSSMSIDSSVSPYEDFSCSKSFSSYSNNSVTTSNSSIDQSGTKIPLDDIMGQSAKKRRKDAKLNETFDKSSQGSITEGILSNDESQASSTTDTDDVTFQNNEQDEQQQQQTLELRKELSTSDFKTKMETIPEIAESSPLKKVSAAKQAESDKKEVELKIETHTMESLQALIEKQKQILETDTESSCVSFVKLSDLDKPPPPTQSKQFENTSMSNSAGARVSRMFHDNQTGHRSLTLQYESRHNSWNMSRSTGNNFANLASSVENSRSLSRLFPHLSKVISSSVPTNVGLNTEQSFYDHLEFVSSDFSCTSSVTSSRSGIDSADESSISCRQPRRLGEDLLKMFLQEIATDVTLEVSNRKMRAHKCILRSRCQYFAAILAGSWVTQAGNVIQLPGYSYSAVHFALCHIYSGASHPPEGISLMELASLSDLLGLEGLKEVTAYALKTNYCHNFHKPCSGCIDGILQVLPVTLNHGLDDLYRKCLKWVCKHFNKVWLTRPFSQLPSDVHQRCRQQISAHLTSENVLNWISECQDMLKSLEQCRWNIINVDNLVRDILDSAYGYVMDHFASLIASDSFLSLGHGDSVTIARLENLFLRTAAALTPEQACRSYPRAVRLNQLLTAKVILPNPLSNESLQIMDRVHRIQLRQEDQDGWNEEFIKLISALLSAIEQCLIRQCSKAMRCSSWLRMDPDLRSKMQKLACLTEPDDLRRLRSSTSSVNSVRNYSASSSVSSRTNDLRQVKLAIQAHSRKLQGGPVEPSNIPVIKKTTARPQAINVQNLSTNGHPVTKCSTRTHVPEKLKPTHRRTQSEEVSSSLNSSKGKPAVIKSRYMEPKKPKTPVLETRATNRLQVKVKHMSSSESSTRGSSPAFNRRQIGVRKSSNLSLDSLQSPSKQRLQLALKAKKENMELSIDSLVDSMKSSMKTEKTISSESLIKRGRNLTDETKLMKSDARGKVPDNNKTPLNSKQAIHQTNQVRKSFLSQKSREILAKSRKHSTNSNSSVTTKSTNPSPKASEINKSSSSASIDSKKKVYNTTLHLRKSAKLPDPQELKKTPVPSKIATATRIVSTSVKNLKSYPTKKSSSTSKIMPSKKVDQQVNRAPIAKPEEEEIMTRMARSNTFSKETSDNPLELLKIIN